MESANLHHQHHQLQENLGHLGSSSSSSLATAPSYYGVGIKHAWTQPTTTTTNTTNLSNPSNSSFNSSSSINMVPDLGFHCWPPSSSNNLNRAGSSSSIKEELSSSSSDSTFPKFTQMLTSPSTTSINLDDDDYHFPPTSLGLIKNEQKEMMMNDLSEKLLLKTLSSSGINHQISLAGDYHHHQQQFYSSNNTHVQNFTQLMPGRSRGQYFSQIYPSINISNLNQQSPPSSAISSCGSSDMNLQAIDLLASSRFSAHEPSNSHGTLGIYNKEIRHNSFGLQQMHQSRTNHHDHHSLLSCGTNSKISSFENEITEVKRSGSLIEPKATQAAAPKKSRLESRTPCPPLKVRKEKLGDRIATLQQLVAPFGKTDTASVLMEAIGYIKFLQNQVETLSVPYMKSSRNNKPSKAMLPGGVIEINGSNGDHERKRDLRSRGLCLVPLSCMSYVTAGTDAATATAGVSGSVNWPSPNYGHGGT